MSTIAVRPSPRSHATADQTPAVTPRRTRSSDAEDVSVARLRPSEVPADLGRIATKLGVDTARTRVSVVPSDGDGWGRAAPSEVHLGLTRRAARDRSLVAHELAHVAQFENRRLGVAPDVTRAESEAAGLAHAARTDRALWLPRDALPDGHIAADDDATGVAVDAGPARAPGVAAIVDQVAAALNRRDETAGVGDRAAAYRILQGVSEDDLIGAVIELDRRFMLDMLIEGIDASDQSEASAVVYAVRCTSPTSPPTGQYLVAAATRLDRLPAVVQDRVLGRVLARVSPGVTVAEVREGMAALDDSSAALDAEGYEEIDDPARMPTQLVGGIAAGEWNPGRMPVPFYIGNAAHVAIAQSYTAAHRADAVFTNVVPIKAILDAAALRGYPVQPSALTDSERDYKPDIANISVERQHLYEIKPARLQALGREEALLYLGALARAGVRLAPGPMNERGTTGALAAPGGWFSFEVVEPGVIVYRYRQPRRVRVRVPVPDPERQNELLRRFALATGLTGTALIIAFILYTLVSEGSRVAFPPRNVLPIP